MLSKTFPSTRACPKTTKEDFIVIFEALHLASRWYNVDSAGYIGEKPKTLVIFTFISQEDLFCVLNMNGISAISSFP